MATTIGSLGNSVGLLYITENDGTTFINPGTKNNSNGVGEIKYNALNRAPVSSSIGAVGSFDFNTLASNDNISPFKIDGIDQITNPVAVLSGQEEAAAILLANEINITIPSSGVIYNAVASGTKVILLAPPSAGSSVNGHVISVNPSLIGNTWTSVNIDGGSDGGEIYSTINGARYFLHASEDAAYSDISSPDVLEITDDVIMRGIQSQIITHSQTISESSLLDIKRISNLTYFNVDAAGNTNLDVVQGSFSINDEIRIVNNSAFTITVRDASISSGNIKINPTTFIMSDSDQMISLRYVDDPTDGLVFKEIARNPIVVGALSIGTTELADNSVTTDKIINDAITTDKIINDAITTDKIINDAVTTDKVINDAITTSKIVNDAITTDKIVNDAVTTDKIVDNSITTDKIVNEAVTVDKLSAEAKIDFFTTVVSFETGEQGITRVRIPIDCTILNIYASISKDISATDDATLIPKNDAGTIMTSGTIDIPANTPINNSATSTPTAENTFETGESMWFETSKTTPGGKLNVTVSYTRT